MQGRKKKERKRKNSIIFFLIYIVLFSNINNKNYHDNMYINNTKCCNYEYLKEMTKIVVNHFFLYEE